jgi:hypothetical protein
MPFGNAPTPTQRPTKFDQIVQRLGLSPSMYAASAELKEWARKHKDDNYVPPRLLELWGFEVNVDIVELLRKPPKRAA